MAAAEPTLELVSLIIDGKTVRVPKGMNIIQAAKAAGIDIPFYCYHPHLSIAGNCRICQIQIKGRPKLEIACNTLVQEGMEILTHFTSPEVKDAQAAVMEFLLINHPLDCTVCDESGHCKLQDYHYQYNARPSRFLENKVHKVKAEPLGPTVVLDGERCIMCTRCIRFCDEISRTSELGMLNRGDRSVISINNDRPLNNPLSGTVVDLCPVGALTHREWRFNTRMWFAKETDSICPGCSTGCNVKVAVRNGQVVQVKARLNSAVNKEWLCDEGRYGFDRFIPRERLTVPSVAGQPASWQTALKKAREVLTPETLVFVSPDLLLEEYDLLKKFLSSCCKKSITSIAYRKRSLTEVEAILISPDYASNYVGAEFSGLVTGDLEAAYDSQLENLIRGTARSVLILGDRAILPKDITANLSSALKAATSVSILADKNSPLVPLSQVVLPGRSILEKSGLMVNRNRRLQYTDRLLTAPPGTEPEWQILNKLASEYGSKLNEASTDRELTLAYLKSSPEFTAVKIGDIKAGGILLGREQ